jgi:hypothetical protein
MPTKSDGQQVPPGLIQGRALKFKCKWKTSANNNQVKENIGGLWAEKGQD